jgi:hypothetical protein
LLVNACRLTIRVRGIVIGIQNLNLITSHKKNATVSAPLSLAFYLLRSAPLYVKLAVAKQALGTNIAGAPPKGESTVCNFPLSRAVVSVLPFREIVPV